MRNDLAGREWAGQPIGSVDAQIAAICASGRPLATRNTDDFDATGIRLVNPWATPS